MEKEEEEVVAEGFQGLDVLRTDPTSQLLPRQPLSQQVTMSQCR